MSVQAIYNQVILDVHFPRVIYKKLKYILPDFSDLEEASPSVAKSLKQVLPP
jgi:hypothetical protein